MIDDIETFDNRFSIRFCVAEGDGAVWPVTRKMMRAFAEEVVR